MPNFEWSTKARIRHSKFDIRNCRGVHTPLLISTPGDIFGHMRNTLPQPSLTAVPTPDDSTFNVVIAYEDFDTGKHARKTYDFLARHLGEEYRFSNQMWKFDVLGVPKLKQMAAKDAVAADIIIISAHGTNELPPEVKGWIELWSKEKVHAMALVGLFDAGECAHNPVRTYLEEVTDHLGLEFFAQPGLWPASAEEARQPLAWEPNGKALSVLANLVHEDKEISCWGINE